MAEIERFSLIPAEKGFYNRSVNKKTVPFANEIALQQPLRPALTPVGSNVDYSRAKGELDEMDRLLADSGVESMAVELALESTQKLSSKRTETLARFAIQSIRTETLRWYLGGISFRALSKAICSSDLYARFCRVIDIEGIRGVSKSTLERSSKLFDDSAMDRLLKELTAKSVDEEGSARIGLDKPLQVSAVLIDGTCLEANVHYPVDWVLLKDCARTLLKAVELIREMGLRQRMPRTPAELARDMNKLCIAFSNTRRQKDGKKTRKKLLRKIVKLARLVAGHARTHADLLASSKRDAKKTLKQAEAILSRINSNLAMLPDLEKQARERIIGERQVDADKKILSIHDLDISVISKGKSGTPSEFGNQLLIAETLDGYIVDSKLHRGQAPSETKQLPLSLERIKGLGIELAEVVTDRGFSSQANSKALGKGIYDCTAPRSVKDLEQRLQEERFRILQKRRAGTESRIATLKNRWLGGRLKAKGFDNRERALKGSILAHNLWILVRIIENQSPLAKAA